MLSIKNLHAGVEGSKILKGLELEVKPGEVHAIMGPNGSGKSTMGYVISGRDGYEVESGSVTTACEVSAARANRADGRANEAMAGSVVSRRAA